MNYGDNTVKPGEALGSRLQSCQKKTRPSTAEKYSGKVQRRKVPGLTRTNRSLARRGRSDHERTPSNVVGKGSEGMGGDLYKLMEGDAPKKSEPDLEDDDLINVADMDDAPTVVKEKDTTDGFTRAEHDYDNSDNFDSKGAPASSHTHVSGPTQSSVEKSTGGYDTGIGPQLESVTAVPSAPESASTLHSSGESDHDSFHNSKEQKKVSPSITRHAPKIISKPSVPAKVVRASRRSQSSSDSILTPLYEKSPSNGTSLYELHKKQDMISLKEQVLDENSQDGDQLSKRKLTLKQRKGRRKEGLSARLKAAGVERVRKDESAGQSGVSGSLPDITRKSKVSRSSQDPKIRLTRRVPEPATTNSKKL